MSPEFSPALSNLHLIHQGKTRDTFPADRGHRLIVATNRLSTHDVVHKSQVPCKGQVLTALTIFWIKQVLDAAEIPHHLVASGADIFDFLPGDRNDYPEDLHHCAIVVKELQMIPIEFIIRAYLTGSLYKKFYAKGLPNPYGIELPAGLSNMSEFALPIFTPTDKSDTDDPISSREVEEKYQQACYLANETFRRIRNRLRQRRIEVADTKLELGLDSQGQVCIGDEVVTPDSSRFFALSELKVGTEPPWLDKQIARDEAERIWAGGEKHPLEFGEEIIRQLSETYQWIFSEITGMSLEDFQRTELD